MRYHPLPTPLKPLVDKFYRAQRSTMRVSTGQIWVAQQQDIVAALCMQGVDGGHWLTSLLVAPTMRRQGLARQLIETALADCRTPTWLFCHPELSDFYLRLGFAPCTDLPLVLAERLKRYQRSKSLCCLRREPSQPTR